MDDRIAALGRLWNAKICDGLFGGLECENCPCFKSRWCNEIPKELTINDFEEAKSALDLSGINYDEKIWDQLSRDLE